ncbi:hypothetical protein ACH4TE_12305 [Streptomyces sioyaensis]|uniref:hypothetical protein n=1 Tax=Streptomyces sioyaensis TaxID=67364 RepID=UPI00378F1AAB
MIRIAPAGTGGTDGSSGQQQPDMAVRRRAGTLRRTMVVGREVSAHRPVKAGQWP